MTELVEEVALLEEIEQAGRAVMKPDEDGGLIGNCGEIKQAQAKALRAILARQRNEGIEAAAPLVKAIVQEYRDAAADQMVVAGTFRLNGDIAKSEEAKAWANLAEIKAHKLESDFRNLKEPE